MYAIAETCLVINKYEDTIDLSEGNEEQVVLINLGLWNDLKQAQKKATELNKENFDQGKVDSEDDYERYEVIELRTN